MNETTKKYALADLKKYPPKSVTHNIAREILTEECGMTEKEIDLARTSETTHPNFTKSQMIKQLEQARKEILRAAARLENIHINLDKISRDEDHQYELEDGIDRLIGDLNAVNISPCGEYMDLIDFIRIVKS